MARWRMVRASCAGKSIVVAWRGVKAARMGGGEGFHRVRIETSDTRPTHVRCVIAAEGYTKFIEADGTFAPSKLAHSDIDFESILKPIILGRILADQEASPEGQTGLA